ncbi:NUDIX hydrolase [Haloechinothrix salitolerans]|uniref:NUDIX domain-containing protein n=1 Tax=Haloechinothrix salitolerans TaxID=926830 RepID=A0ABW2C5X7_9PSEU
MRAAGAVLWRTGPDGGDGIEVAVVHRPRYDDWSLPKGKLDPGETVPAAAAREVAEETGFSCVLGPRLSRCHYQVQTGSGAVADKAVTYFSARARDGVFQPNEEVDTLRWLAPPAARALLDYAGEIEALDELSRLGTDLTTVLLVRHAKAGKREHWRGDDDLRPLTPAGNQQADALRTLLPLFGPDRVHSAPRLRCVQTVQPIADDMDVSVTHEPLLSEEGYWSDPDAGLARLRALAADAGTPVVSSQGKVIPHLVRTLAEHDGVPLDDVPSKKGSVWLLSFRRPAIEPVSTDGIPRLVAASYLPPPAAAATSDTE